MRDARFILTTALVLLPVFAAAQQPTPTPAPAPPPAPGAPDTRAAAPDTVEEYVQPAKNFVDFGARWSSLSGDAARYERYRDLGNGLFLETFRLHKETANHWFLDASGEHVGRRDQRFTGEFVLPGKVKASLRWDQIPMLMSRTTQTMYAGPPNALPNILTIDDAYQTLAQTSASNLATVVQNARTFELKSRRHIFEGATEFIASPTLTFKVSYRNMNRDGGIPYGGSFGHGSVVETIAPVSHQLNDFDGGAEYMRGPVLLRGGYSASIFNNSYTTLTFDNPWRAVDITTASSRGRASLPPSNSMFSVNALGAVKFAGKSRLTAYVSTGSLKDTGDLIMPQTVNSVATGVLALPRTAVNGEARTMTTNLTFTSHPSRLIDINARYRYYDYDNRTAQYHTFQRVAYDNSPSAVAAGFETEPFGIKRSSLDADVKFVPQMGTAIGVGFSNLRDERTHRIFGETNENIVRLTFDSVSSTWFTVRTKYEHSEKRGTLDHEVYEEFSLIDQPGLRQFDIAARDRDRVTLLGSATPIENVSFNVSVAAGKDDYLQSLFGLRDNTHRVYSGGMDASPAENVGFSVWYSYEKYTSLSRSRQASPGVQQLDESRNWATDGADRVHSVVASADITKLAEKVDIRLAYDFSRSRSRFNYITGPVADRTLPEESTVLPSTLPAPTQLPPTLSLLSRATADVKYAVTPHVGFGVSLWYERFNVEDFSLDAQAISRLDLPGALLMGYAYRPYTARTVWGRMTYTW